jgi:hypothetical protein
VRTLAFTARNEGPTPWSASGRGTVDVVKVGLGVLTFTESGTWRPEGWAERRFSNVYRWSLVEPAEAIRLEHLRFGVANPVYLLDLVPNPDGEWQSVSPHLCSEDCYSAQLAVLAAGIRLRWRVTGPKKRDVIEYTYSW